MAKKEGEKRDTNEERGTKDEGETGTHLRLNKTPSKEEDEYRFIVFHR